MIVCYAGTVLMLFGSCESTVPRDTKEIYQWKKDKSINNITFLNLSKDQFYKNDSLNKYYLNYISLSKQDSKLLFDITDSFKIMDNYDPENKIHINRTVFELNKQFFQDFNHLKALNLNGQNKIRIENCVLNDELEFLSFRGANMLYIPKTLFPEQSKLTFLDISSNFISNLDFLKIQNLPLLKILILRNNPIKEIPPEFFKKNKIEILDLSYCNLNSIPQTIELCSDIKELHLSNNNIKEIDIDFRKMKNLKLLDLSHNPLSSLPHSILSLKNKDFTIKLENVEIKPFSDYQGIGNDMIVESFKQNALYFPLLDFNSIDKQQRPYQGYIWNLSEVAKLKSYPMVNSNATFIDILLDLEFLKQKVQKLYKTNNFTKFDQIYCFINNANTFYQRNMTSGYYDMSQMIILEEIRLKLLKAFRYSLELEKIKEFSDFVDNFPDSCRFIYYGDNTTILNGLKSYLNNFYEKVTRTIEPESFDKYLIEKLAFFKYDTFRSIFKENEEDLYRYWRNQFAAILGFEKLDLLKKPKDRFQGIPQYLSSAFYKNFTPENLFAIVKQEILMDKKIENLFLLSLELTMTTHGVLYNKDQVINSHLDNQITKILKERNILVKVK